MTIWLTLHSTIASNRRTEDMITQIVSGLGIEKSCHMYMLRIGNSLEGTSSGRQKKVAEWGKG